MTRILVIEDNAELGFGLQNNLEVEGYDVRLAPTGRLGVELARQWSPNLVILDLMLPELDGFQVLRRVRAQDTSLPIMILTAKSEETDKVRGLRLGADDYVTKPFGLLELLARVEALLRRTGAEAARADAMDVVERFANIEIRPAARTVTRDGRTVELTPKEFDLLTALVRRRGRVASRLELLQSVWDHSAAVVTRTVDTHIAELRRKLEVDPGSPKHIVTVRKIGYRLIPDP
jgi:DNA-binding response OmpR family regulator